MTSYGLDEWFWAMFERTWTWPNFQMTKYMDLSEKNLKWVDNLIRFYIALNWEEKWFLPFKKQT